MKKPFRRILALVFIVILLASFVYYILQSGSEKPPGAVMADSAVPTPVLLFGIPVDSFEVITSAIRRDQYLGGILSDYRLGSVKMISITDSIKKVFDVTDLRKGNSYTVFLSPDSMELRYFVYEHSPVDFLLVEVHDSTVHASMQQRKLRTEKMNAVGEISSSLWNTMRESGYNPLLALELSEVYAWTVDFFGLQRGDCFRVIYEEKFVDTVSLGIEKIHAAIFTHNGKEILAVPYVQDGRESYFDQEGNSLRRAFLKAPLRYSRIASRFSNSRMHPILRIRRPHHAVDYSAPSGTPVLSIGDGKVIQMGYNGASGNMIKVRHNSVYTTVYIHLSGYAKGLRAGSQVLQGQVIGYVGSTGLSTGPHLDFRVYKNGSPIDPLKMEAPSVEPIKPENRMAFDSVKGGMVKELMKLGIQGIDK
jgi:murein DD-endopeptidase MepM/ murein hydrolase activator NlpD